MSDLSLLGVAREPKILLVIDFYNLKASIAESLGTGIWKFNPDIRRFTEMLFGTKVSEYVKIKIVTKIIKTDKSIALISALENIPNCVPYYPDEKDFFDNWDDEMIKIILRDEQTCDYDIVCLVSGDGTFYSPLQELLAMGKKAFIISRIGNINKCYIENEELIIIDYSDRIKEFIIYPDTTKTTPVDESKDPLLTFEMLGIANPNKTKTITSLKKPNDFKEPKIDILTKLLNSKKWLKFGNLSELLLQFYHSIANSSDDIEDIIGLLYSEFNKIPGLKINLIISELAELTSNLRKEKTNTIAEIRNLKNRLLTIEKELEKINSEKLKQEIAKTVRVLESYDEIRNYMRLAEVNIEETGKKENFLKDRIETMQYQVSELQRKLQKIHLKIEVIEEIMSQHIGKDPDVNIAKIQPGKPDICEDNDILTKLDSLGMWSGLGTCQAYVVNDLIEKKCLKSEIIKKASESKESLKMYLLSLGVRENYIDKIYPVLIKNQVIINGQINFGKIQKIINLHTKKIQNKIEKKKKKKK